MTVTRTRRSSAETREHVLATAGELFYRDGIRATGVDRVAAAAAVAPTTLYRLFASKDDLVTAYLAGGRVAYLAWLERGLGSAGTPRERLLAAFDEQAAAAAPSYFHGCPFLLALAEFPDPRHPAHVAAVETKAEILRRLREGVDELAAQEPVPDPAALAGQLMLLMEGVYGAIQAFGHDGPARHAPAAAAALLP